MTVICVDKLLIFIFFLLPTRMTHLSKREKQGLKIAYLKSDILR